MKHIHQAKGIKYIPKKYIIEKGAISAFHKAIIFEGEVNDNEDDDSTTSLYKLCTPATFTRYLKPGALETEIDNPYSDRLDGSSEWSYISEIKAGDTITVSGNISEVKIRNGSLGEMCIVKSTLNYVKQQNEISCTQINTIIYYNYSAKRQMQLSPNTSAPIKNFFLNPTIANFDSNSISIGDNIPGLIKQPSTQQLVMYAGASRDFYQVHYDQQFAQSIGLPKVIVHGALKSAFLGQMITDFINQSATLNRLFVRYNSIDFEGCLMKCKGTITKIVTVNSKKIIDCDIWIENSVGIKTTEGTATFNLK